MTYSNEDKFRRREQDLKERELNIRLRELEYEIEKDTKQDRDVAQEPARSVEVTTDEPNAKRRTKNRAMRKIINIGKLFALMVVVIIAMRIAYWLATLIMVVAIAFAAYMLFIKD